MLDVNKNGKLDPEEDALGDILADEAVSGGAEKRKALTWVFAGMAVLLIILLIILIAFAM